ncbi:hypothetical protein ACIQU4_03395 [Streptomyces sp. NPDC090741]|uniref:hypothetical protein n=1 Tax=Streptomyces sp. NPDC090741 TaxID=3365967 RepID=UPI0037F56542
MEDADGYLISERVRQEKATKSIVDIVREHYGSNGGSARRFKNYYTQRFGGSISTAASLARYMLTMEIDPVISTGREYLISRNAGGNGSVLMPWMLPGDRLDNFCNGFADQLKARADSES